MKLYTYLNYAGNCQEAFRFYEQHLGGKITMMMTHGQGPNPNAGGPDWKNAILHARMTIGETELLGADIPNAQPVRSAYLTLIPARAKRSESLPRSPTAARFSCHCKRRFSPFALGSSGTSSARPG